MAHLITQFAQGSRLAPWLETAWLQRYLERRLDAEESAWFEAYLIDKPGLLDRLERDIDLRDGLGLVHDTSAAEVSQPTDDDVLQRRARRSRGRYLRPLALAATLVAGVGIGWFGRLAAPDGAAVVFANPMRVVYDTERGSATPPHIEHADSDSPYALIEVALPPGAQAIGLHVGGVPAKALQASAEGFASFLVARPLVTRGASAELTWELDGVRSSKTLALGPRPATSD
jgi:hypothetical protein